MSALGNYHGGNVRSNENQQRSRGQGQVCQGLKSQERESISVLSLKRGSIGCCTHELENDEDLGSMPVARQGKQERRQMHHHAVLTRQLGWVLASFR